MMDAVGRDWVELPERAATFTRQQQTMPSGTSQPSRCISTFGRSSLFSTCAVWTTSTGAGGTIGTTAKNAHLWNRS